MTPEQIIETLKEYFKGRMDEKINLDELGFSFLFLGAECNKEILLNEFEENEL